MRQTALIIAMLIFIVSVGGCKSKKNGSGGVGTNTPQLATISVTPANASIAKGYSFQFIATGIYSDNSTKDISSLVTWSTSSSMVCVVSNTAGINGHAMSVGEGTASVIATMGTISDSSVMTVTAAELIALDIYPNSVSIAKGTSQLFTAIGVFSDYTAQNLTAQVTWSSSDDNIASITTEGAAKGVTVSVSVGVVSITASIGGKTNSSMLTVTPATISSIILRPEDATIGKGTNQQFTARGVFSDATTQDLTSQVTWTSTSGDIATISNDLGSIGLATSTATGTTGILATYGGRTGSTLLTVGSAPLVSIDVTPSSPSIKKGENQQLTAWGNYLDSTSQNITTSVTWISNGTVVSVSNASGSKGLAYGSGVGSTTVTAIDLITAVTGTTAIIVTPPTLVSIQVTPANSGIKLGYTKQFQATGIMSDGSQVGMTNKVTWGSYNSAVIQFLNGVVGAEGLGTSGGDLGSTTIYAYDPVTSIRGDTLVSVVQ